MFFRMVYKSGQIFLPFCYNSRVWRTDGQTDGRTDRNLITIPRLHYMQRGKNIRHSFPTLSLSISLHNYPNIYLSILFLFLQFSMIVSIYLLLAVLWFIRTVFLHVLNMLFGLMTTRLNKRYYYKQRKVAAITPFKVIDFSTNRKLTTSY